MKRSKKFIIDSLENLVHKRFNINTLTNELEKIFNSEINLYQSDAEADELLGDYCVSFCIGVDYGVFDIYYLPHKQVDANGNDFYITEVEYSFGC